MLAIYKGDDTGGTLGKRLIINVQSDVSLVGCVLIFNYQGITRRFENVSSGQNLEVFFSHNETSKMSVGTFKATLISVDSAGKIRTITDTIFIKVTTNLTECYGDVTFQVNIGVAIDWSNIVNKPLNGKTIDISTDNGVVAALGTIIEHLGGTVK